MSTTHDATKDQSLECTVRRLFVDAAGLLASHQLNRDTSLGDVFISQESCEQTACKRLVLFNHLDKRVLSDQLTKVVGTESSCSSLEGLVGDLTGRRPCKPLDAGREGLAFPVRLHKAFELLDDQWAKRSNVVLIGGGEDGDMEEKVLVGALGG
jgi:hypothetical protein